MRGVVAALMVIGVVAAACNGGTGDPFGADTIAVLDSTGRLWLVEPDTGDRRAVPVDGGIANYPVWSPDAGRLAWTDVGTGGFAVSSFDGNEVSTVTTEFASFYNYWGPDSRLLGYLGDHESSVGFGIADLGRSRTEVVDASRPYYFSWSPGGDRVAAHAGESLRVVTTDGEVLASMSASTLFQAPVWLPDSDEVLALVGPVGSTRLVALDVESGEERAYLQVSGFALLVLDPTGRRLAVVHRPGTGAPDVLQAALQPSAPAGLFVLDLESGEVTAIDANPLRLSPFWDPEGERLLSLTVDERAPRQWARWEVHDLEGELVARTDPMNPSVFVAQVLPFADQYAQSTTPWAPDGSAFVFSGRVEGIGEGVFVHPGEGFDQARRLTDGAYAIWSPR